LFLFIILLRSLAQVAAAVVVDLRDQMQMDAPVILLEDLEDLEEPVLSEDMFLPGVVLARGVVEVQHPDLQ
jgi:hypothetical protein